MIHLSVGFTGGRRECQVTSDQWEEEDSEVGVREAFWKSEVLREGATRERWQVEMWAAALGMD